MNFTFILDNSLFLIIQFNPPKSSKYKQNWPLSPFLRLPLHQDYVSLSLARTTTAAFLRPLCFIPPFLNPSLCSAPFKLQLAL